MNIDRYSVITISKIESEFAMPYSHFKYGSKSKAREFGLSLAESFAKSDIYRELCVKYDFTSNAIAITAAPYKFIPTASFHLKDYFLHAFNRIHARRFNKSLEEFKIFRGHSYHDDYGNMTETQRVTAITSDDFYVDTNFIKNKVLFILDDIRVTGAHENRISNLLDKHDGDVVYITYADVDMFAAVPSIEARLNLYGIKSLKDVDSLIESDEFLFNTRVVKYILAAPKDDFIDFIGKRSSVFKDTLEHYAYGNEYFSELKYAENLSILAEILRPKALGAAC